MPDIKLKKVVKRFGKIIALKEMSLDIRDGEFFVLVGPTGAGKTTTLRVVSGLEKIDTGEIYLGDENAAQLSPADRDVAFVYQSFSLYPQMTVRQNLEFPLKSPLHKVTKEEVANRVDFVAKLLHITPLLDRMPNALSGGEMQRVGIGRAMVRKPQMFLMDEPLSDLDAKLREELRVELRQIQRELKTTTLYVTHDQIEAMSMGDRVAVLDEGIVHQVGVPKEVYDAPADLFVAGFIGVPKMNFFKCAVQPGAGGAAVLSLEGGVIKLPFGGNGGGAAAKKIQKLPKKEGLILGVRPEAVKIQTARDAGAFQADVLFLEHFGSMNIVNLKVGDKIFKSRTPATFRAETNERVGISFDGDKVIFFDAGTGKAVS